MDRLEHVDRTRLTPGLSFEAMKRFKFVRSITAALLNISISIVEPDLTLILVFILRYNLIACFLPGRLNSNISASLCIVLIIIGRLHLK